MSDQLTGLYLANVVLLTVHEVDSSYWREWDLLRLPGGRRSFLLLHFPLLGLVLLGLLLVREETTAGYLLSLLLSGSGVVAFVLHMSLIARGHAEFRDAISVAVLVLTLAVSVLQGAVTLTEWV